MYNFCIHFLYYFKVVVFLIKMLIFFSLNNLLRIFLKPLKRRPVLQDVEALLFGFQSIAETGDVHGSDVIPGLIGLLPRISISTALLADTVMYTIGRPTPSCTPWVGLHRHVHHG